MRLGLGALLLSIAAPAVVAQEAPADVRSWLDRMNVAIEQLNYRGRFVHVIEGNAEELRIVHRFADGVVGERISSGTGDGSEILTTGDGVRSVFPSKKLVVEESERSTIPVASSLSYTDELEHYYQITSFARGSVADRETQVVSIRPRDEYRYGYLLFLDQETALPLKIQVRDEQGQVIESILFTEISVLDSIPEYAVASSISAEGFTVKRPVDAGFESTDPELWAATRLPSGFRLSLARQSLMAGSRYPVQHLVYTDGLATVSVFIAHPDSDPDMPEGFSRLGSTNAFTLTVDGRLATAIGEVPGRTVQRIATSLDAR
jgi:sigma-E factor negative regulatory protein RseB